MNTIQLHPKEGYTILQLQRGKVNAINQEMVHELQDCFKNFEHDDAVKGVLLTGIPHFFSAGLDLIELIRYNREEMDHFFQSFFSPTFDIFSNKWMFLYKDITHFYCKCFVSSVSSTTASQFYEME